MWAPRLTRSCRPRHGRAQPGGACPAHARRQLDSADWGVLGVLGERGADSGGAAAGGSSLRLPCHLHACPPTANSHLSACAARLGCVPPSAPRQRWRAVQAALPAGGQARNTAGLRVADICMAAGLSPWRCSSGLAGQMQQHADRPSARCTPPLATPQAAARRHRVHSRLGSGFRRSREHRQAHSARQGGARSWTGGWQRRNQAHARLACYGGLRDCFKAIATLKPCFSGPPIPRARPPALVAPSSRRRLREVDQRYASERRRHGCLPVPCGTRHHRRRRRRRLPPADALAGQACVAGGAAGGWR